MYLRRGRAHTTVAVVALLALTAFFKMSEGRPHMRHQKSGNHCSRCAPGWGVIRPCIRGRDTYCEKCLPGSYSPHHSVQPCWICSRCGPGLYEAHRCTAKRDTVCDSCRRVAPENPDYRAKCSSENSFFLAPEDAENTGEESLLVNQPRSLAFDAEEERLLEKDAAAAAAATAAAGTAGAAGAAGTAGTARAAVAKE